MADRPASLVLALTTEASEERAEALARHLLECGLAACVGLRRLRSLYVWQGQLEDTAEVQLLIKTDPGRLAALAEAVHALHSYTTPEWITWSADASAAYGAWVAQSCAPDPITPDGAAPAPPDSPGDGAPAG